MYSGVLLWQLSRQLAEGLVFFFASLSFFKVRTMMASRLFGGDANFPLLG